MAASKLAVLLIVVLQLSLCQITTGLMPEFLQPLENHTVIQGRDVSFTCVVNHLQNYKVAWIKSDSRAILAMQNHMVAHNPRLSVTHNGHNTWKLHITNVQKNDSGSYMCQINTDPMLSQTGYMGVVIPPDIKDDESANGLVVHENGNVRLRCAATGTPVPTVVWKREDGKNIITREAGQTKPVSKYEGETLELTSILRQEMGSYLCIASNGIPPAVSKRYSIRVHFQPVIKVTSQLVAAPLDSDVVLQCSVEASPHAMNTWYRNLPIENQELMKQENSYISSPEKLLPSAKYIMTEHALNEYTWLMNLTVRNLTKEDFVNYVCSSDNALGKAEGVVRLQELHLPSRTTPTSYVKPVDVRPRKKPVKPIKKKPNNRKPYEDNGDFFDNVNGNRDDHGITQLMSGSSPAHEGHRTERPPLVPAISTPWDPNAARTKRIDWHFVCPFLLIAVTL